MICSNLFLPGGFTTAADKYFYVHHKMALLLGFYIRPGGMQEKVPYMTKFDRKHKKREIRVAVCLTQ